MRTNTELQHAYDNAHLTGESRQRIIREFARNNPVVGLVQAQNEWLAKTRLESGWGSLTHAHTGFEVGAL